MKEIKRTTVYTAAEVREMYNGILPDSKRRLMNYLEKDGYSFFVNNARGTASFKKWKSIDCLLVASSTSKPNHLWAIGPVGEEKVRFCLLT